MSDNIDKLKEHHDSIYKEWKQLIDNNLNIKNWLSSFNLEGYEPVAFE
jgi:hypothetical protein